MNDTVEQQLSASAERVRDAGLDLAAVQHRVRGRRRRVMAQRLVGGVALVAAGVVAVPLVAGTLGTADSDRVTQAIVATAPSADPRPVMSPDVISLSATLPGQFARRTPLPSCGTYRLGQGKQRVPEPGISCLLGAVGGPVGGELGLSRPTIEGDPIVAWYRALPDSDRIEVYRDTTADNWSSGGQWTYEICGAGRGALEPVRDCSAPQVLAYNSYPPCIPVGPMAIADLLRTTGGAATPEQAAELFARWSSRPPGGMSVAPRAADQAATSGFAVGGWVAGPQRDNTVEVRNATGKLSAQQFGDGTWFIVGWQHCA